MFGKYLWLGIRTIVLLQLLIGEGFGEFSGFYVDNGIGQTVMQESIPLADSELLRHHMLELLDLPDRPDTERFPSVIRKSVPKFLFKLYKQLSEKDDEAIDDDDDNDSTSMPSNVHNVNKIDGITDEHTRIIEQSDIIMTFLNNRNAFATSYYDNETRLSFDLSEVSSLGTELLMSELHLFKRRLLEKELGSNLCQVTIYDATFGDRSKTLHPIHTVNTTVDFEGWIQINFTSMLSEWIVTKRPNNMLYITIEYQNEMGQFEASSIDANYLLSYWDSEHQPFITAYFKNEDSDGHVLSYQHKHRRSKRSTYQLEPRRSRTSNLLNPLLYLQRSNHFRSCQIYSLYVSFQELRWDDWIIAPSGYEASYCSGSCDFPIPHDVTTTNHAVIQTLVHLLNHDIPKPCCAPSKLQAISLLYSQNETISHIKRYRGMIAKKCACQ